MQMKRRFHFDKVQFELAAERAARWKFRSLDLHGTEYEYRVLDGNFPKMNKWTFVVRVPSDFIKGEYITVVPSKAPQRRVLANIERRSINLNKCTKGRYRGWVYAKATVADADSNAHQFRLRWDERAIAPPWLKEFRLHRKSTVTNTDGTDGNALVVVIRADDYEEMIRLHLALKAWVLADRFVMPD